MIPTVSFGLTTPWSVKAAQTVIPPHISGAAASPLLAMGPEKRKAIRRVEAVFAIDCIILKTLAAYPGLLLIPIFYAATSCRPGISIVSDGRVLEGK
jgi:hypothetical protein